MNHIIEKKHKKYSVYNCNADLVDDGFNWEKTKKLDNSYKKYMKYISIIRNLSDYFHNIGSVIATNNDTNSSLRVNIRMDFELYINCSCIIKSNNSGNTQEKNSELGCRSGDRNNKKYSESVIENISEDNNNECEIYTGF